MTVEPLPVGPPPMPHLEAHAQLAALFDAHFDTVFGFCAVRSGSRQLAEEIASDVFADAARVVVATPDADIGPGWLIAVAKRRMIDHWRRAERHQRRIDRLLRERAPEAPTPPDDLVVDDERLATALMSLPERQRMVLVLRYLDDHSVSEVATQAGVSYQAAESLLARARRSLIAAYEESR